MATGAGTRSRKQCVHHWMLGEPVGGVIDARCRNCERTRTYSTNPEGNDRFDDYRELTAASSYHMTRQERATAA